MSNHHPGSQMAKLIPSSVCFDDRLVEETFVKGINYSLSLGSDLVNRVHFPQCSSWMWKWCICGQCDVWTVVPHSLYWLQMNSNLTYLWKVFVQCPQPSKWTVVKGWAEHNVLTWSHWAHLFHYTRAFHCHHEQRLGQQLHGQTSAMIYPAWQQWFGPLSADHIKGNVPGSLPSQGKHI